MGVILKDERRIVDVVGEVIMVTYLSQSIRKIIVPGDVKEIVIYDKLDSRTVPFQ